MSTKGPTCTCDAIEVTAKCPACPTAADQTPAMRHFAPWGSHTASCGAVLASDEAPESPRFTARRDDTTCPDCRAHFTNPAVTHTSAVAVSNEAPGTQVAPATDSERVEQIRARAEAATPGPWESYTVPDAPGEPCYSAVEIGDHEVRLDWLYGSGLDANFIAQARDDVPWLLDEVTRLAALLAEQAATIKAIRTARAGHPRCELHEDDEGWVNCGWKRAVADIDTALGSQRTEGQG